MSNVAPVTYPEGLYLALLTMPVIFRRDDRLECATRKVLKIGYSMTDNGGMEGRLDLHRKYAEVTLLGVLLPPEKRPSDYKAPITVENKFHEELDDAKLRLSVLCDKKGAQSPDVKPNEHYPVASRIYRAFRAKGREVGYRWVKESSDLSIILNTPCNQSLQLEHSLGSAIIGRTGRTLAGCLREDTDVRTLVLGHKFRNFAVEEKARKTLASWLGLPYKPRTNPANTARDERARRRSHRRDSSEVDPSTLVDIDAIDDEPEWDFSYDTDDEEDY